MYAPGLQDLKERMEATNDTITRELEQRLVLGNEKGKEEFDLAMVSATAACQSIASVDAEDITGFSFYQRTMLMSA